RRWAYIPSGWSVCDGALNARSMPQLIPMSPCVCRTSSCDRSTNKVPPNHLRHDAGEIGIHDPPKPGEGRSSGHEVVAPTSGVGSRLASEVSYARPCVVSYFAASDYLPARPPAGLPALVA